jgi:hypothetical protein
VPLLHGYCIDVVSENDSTSVPDTSSVRAFAVSRMQAGATRSEEKLKAKFRIVTPLGYWQLFSPAGSQGNGSFLVVHCTSRRRCRADSGIRQMLSDL